MKKFPTLLLATAYLLFFWAGPVMAQTPPGVNLTIDMVIAAIQNLACWAFRVAAMLVLIMLLVYGVMFVMSGGDSSKFQEARKALTWGIIGAFVVFGVYVIIISVAAFVGATTFSIGFNC